MWIIYIIVILFLIFLGISKLVLNMAFGKRCEGNPKLKYYTANDFQHLNADPIEFQSDKRQTLRGNIYRNKEIDKYKGIVVFVHGMGGGHLSYTTEINTLAQAGFIVIGYDNTGTCYSDGKNLKGFFQSVIDLDNALKFIEDNNELNSYSVELVGHSWGAYTVCQVLQFDHNIKAVVALSGFNNSARLICDSMKNETKINFNFLKPFITIINFLTFGKKGIQNTIQILKNTNTPVLVLHGELDKSVYLENSLIQETKSKMQKSNLKTIVYKDKFHNVYQSKESEAYLNSTFEKISNLNKKYKDKIPEEYNTFYDNIDYKKMTAEDEEVMNTIVKFLEEKLV